jgi:hypothetical protein
MINNAQLIFTLFIWATASIMAVFVSVHVPFIDTTVIVFIHGHDRGMAGFTYMSRSLLATVLVTREYV